MEHIPSKYHHYKYIFKYLYDREDTEGKKLIKEKVQAALQLKSDRMFYLFLSAEKSTIVTKGMLLSIQEKKIAECFNISVDDIKMPDFKSEAA